MAKGMRANKKSANVHLILIAVINPDMIKPIIL